MSAAGHVPPQTHKGTFLLPVFLSPTNIMAPLLTLVMEQRSDQVMPTFRLGETKVKRKSRRGINIMG